MIKIKDLSFKYATSDDYALKNINISCDNGEFVVLAGRSGCGKTTLTRVINRLVPEFYEGTLEGDFFIDGKDMSGAAVESLAGTVGSVFQDPRSQFFATDTLSEIAFSCENLNMDPSEIMRRVQAAVADIQIKKLVGKSIFNLSSGEKQSVAIASVYTLSPKILVLDEPSANLDTAATENLRRILNKLKNQGITIIISEHRLSYLRDLADRVLVFEHGEIVREFSAIEFQSLTNARANELGLRCTDMSQLSAEKKHIYAEETVLSLKGINFSYDKTKDVLCNINLEIKRGSVVGIIGKNGAGKSTLLDIICGLKKQKSGNIYFNGVKTTPKYRISNSYIVMQNSDCQLFTESVEKELYLGRKAGEGEKIRGEEILTDLGIDSLFKRHPASLSGGQKQRLGIALSYFKDSDVICMDEPTSGLDFNGMANVSGFINNMAKRGNTFLIASHDFEFLLKSCSHICCLEECWVTEYFVLNNITHKKLWEVLHPAMRDS